MKYLVNLLILTNNTYNDLLVNVGVYKTIGYGNGFINGTYPYFSGKTIIYKEKNGIKHVDYSTVIRSIIGILVILCIEVLVFYDIVGIGAADDTIIGFLVVFLA
jgi:hypothetical protein